MANPHRGEHEIEIGGERHTFRYSLNKLANLQEKVGVESINELMERLMTVLGFGTLRYMIWLGIAEYDPKSKTWSGPTEDEVGEWEIDIELISREIRTALFRAFRGGRALEEPEEEEEGASADPGPPQEAGHAEGLTTLP